MVEFELHSALRPPNGDIISTCPLPPLPTKSNLNEGGRGPVLLADRMPAKKRRGSLTVERGRATFLLAPTLSLTPVTDPNSGSGVAGAPDAAPDG